MEPEKLIEIVKNCFKPETSCRKCEIYNEDKHCCNIFSDDIVNISNYYEAKLQEERDKNKSRREWYQIGYWAGYKKALEDYK